MTGFTAIKDFLYSIYSMIVAKEKNILEREKKKMFFKPCCDNGRKSNLTPVVGKTFSQVVGKIDSEFPVHIIGGRLDQSCACLISGFPDKPVCVMH